MITYLIVVGVMTLVFALVVAGGLFVAYVSERRGEGVGVITAIALIILALAVPIAYDIEDDKQALQGISKHSRE